MIYHDEDFPMGLRCPDCDRLFTEGEPIGERLGAMQDDIPVCTLICVGCALSGEAS